VVIEPSSLGPGMTQDGTPPAAGPIRRLKSREFTDEFFVRGNKSRGLVRGRETIYRIGEGEGGWRLQVRTFPDGVAWRYHYPGEGVRRVLGERTAFTFPAGTALWATYQTRNYEGRIYRREMAEGGLPSPPPREDSPTLGLPLSFQLPDGSYGSILENSHPGYSGMTLLPVPGQRELRAAFDHDPDGWEMEGEIVSSWRVVLTGPTLDDLVGSDILPSLSPPPDPGLFPDGLRTGWCRPGVGGWSWWAEGTEGMTWDLQTGLVDRCAELGWPYYLVDSGWEDPARGWFEFDGAGPWERLAELCRFGEERGVGIWVWRSWYPDLEKHWPGLETAEKQEEFFRRVREAGAAGVKIDFIDSESAVMLDRMRGSLERAARSRLMINFHGVAKPAGESWTWPNEMTREGVRGLEHNKWGSPLLPEHYSQVLFTRYLSGPGDFTPVALHPLGGGETTEVFQLATAILTTSPFLVLAELPETYLNSPFRPLLKRLPAVWDDTRVLPGSTIGGPAGLIRRSGEEWWIAVVNPGPARVLSIPLPGCASGRHLAEIWSDGEGEEPAMENRSVKGGELLEMNLSAGGGAVIILIHEGARKFKLGGTVAPTFLPVEESQQEKSN
jgi:alpha-glucosidase